jgi:enoyl-CoA hydratase/carnithine racemase
MRMTTALTQFTIDEPATGYWRVTFDHPPVNLVDPDTLLELEKLTGMIEADKTLRVVVVDSAHPDYFINRYDISRAAETPLALGPTGLPGWADVGTRLAETPVVTIALIRGRARGGGAEITLACDMRFASLERAILGQPEVAAGLFPGGGAIERLPPLIGRARALEVILGSDDVGATTAELYGWVNRALPDDELDAFVENLARRIASFDIPALTAAKRFVNRRTLPPSDDIVETQTDFLRAFAWPTTQERAARIGKRIGEVGPDFELNLGHHLANLDQDGDQ